MEKINEAKNKKKRKSRPSIPANKPPRQISATKKYIKSLNKIKEQIPTIELEIMEFLNLKRNRKIIPANYEDHQLKGNKKGLREAHIRGDLLLAYQLDDDTITLIDVGSHSQLGLG